MADNELERMLGVDVNSSGDGIQYVVVKLGNEQFGIDINVVDNIVRMQRITRIPKAQPYYKGVINLRGEVVPVMCMRTKFGMEPAEYTNATRIIITKFDQNAYVGFIVDEVKHIVTFEDAEIEKVKFKSASVTDNYLKGVGKNDDMLISILNMNAIVDEGENA